MSVQLRYPQFLSLDKSYMQWRNMGLKQQLFVHLLSILECFQESKDGRWKRVDPSSIDHSTVFCELTPMLKQEEVCDLIIMAIRQNQYRLLIPKSLNISYLIGRFENESDVWKKFSHFLFFSYQFLSSSGWHWNSKLPWCSSIHGWFRRSSINIFYPFYFPFAT